MNDKPAIKTDTDFVAALLGLVDSGDRHRLLAELAERIARDILVAASETGASPVPIPMDDEGVDAGELVESFLQDVRPLHDAHGYLDDEWNFIWEQAWPEGVADAVLGSEAYDRYAAAELVEAIERKAEDIGLPEPPWFDVDDMEVFVKLWRSRFIEELSKVKARA